MINQSILPSTLTFTPMVSLVSPIMLKIKK